MIGQYTIAHGKQGGVTGTRSRLLLPRLRGTGDGCLEFYHNIRGGKGESLAVTVDQNGTGMTTLWSSNATDLAWEQTLLDLDFVSNTSTYQVSNSIERVLQGMHWELSYFLFGPLRL